MDTNIFYFLFIVNSKSENDKKNELYIFNIKKSFMSINTSENTNFSLFFWHGYTL